VRLCCDNAHSSYCRRVFFLSISRFATNITKSSVSPPFDPSPYFEAGTRTSISHPQAHIFKHPSLFASRVVTGLLTARNTLRRHLHIIGLTAVPCPGDAQQRRNPQLTFCVSEALATHRRAYLGSYFLDPEDVRNLLLGPISNYIKGTGLPCLEFQLMGQEGPEKGLRASRSKGLDPLPSLFYYLPAPVSRKTFTPKVFRTFLNSVMPAPCASYLHFVSVITTLTYSKHSTEIFHPITPLLEV
jgi:hypothetical protein